MRNTYLSNLAEKIKIVFQMKLQQALQISVNARKVGRTFHFTKKTLSTYMIQIIKILFANTWSESEIQ